MNALYLFAHYFSGMDNVYFIVFWVSEERREDTLHCKDWAWAKDKETRSRAANIVSSIFLVRGKVEFPEFTEL